MEIEVYYRPTCPYSIRALKLLDEKRENMPKLKYTLYDITGMPSLREEMIERSDRKTVPQVFINGEHIGGCDDLYALDDKFWKKLRSKK